MAQQNINIGVADAGTGDNYFTAFTKVEANFNELFASNIFTKRVLVNSTSDLPTPVSGSYPLEDNKIYVFANDVDLGSVDFDMEENTAVVGLDTIVITLTYTGATPLFNSSDSTVSVKNLNILHPNADLFSFSDSGSETIRVVDVTSTGKSIGTLSGTNSLARFTNFSPSLTTNGMSFSGNWKVFVFEPSFADIAAGIFFNLGSATFDNFAVTQPNIEIQTGATFLSGAVSSANINTGGRGIVSLGSFSGAGTILSGVTEEDALWEFFHNDDIRDTRPDALLSLQGNAVAETITVAGTPVKVTGNNTWVDERSSQSTSDNTGKSTYNGGKPVVVPITMRGSVEPSLGTNKLISLYVAINGTPVTNSKATANCDAGDPKSITVIWQVEAQPNDFVEMYVSNDTDTTNVLVSSAVIRIN